MKTSPAMAPRSTRTNWDARWISPLRLEQCGAGAVFSSPNMTNMHMHFRPFTGWMGIPPINVPAWKAAQAGLPKAEQKRLRKLLKRGSNSLLDLQLVRDRYIIWTILHQVQSDWSRSWWLESDQCCLGDSIFITCPVPKQQPNIYLYQYL